MSNLEVLKINWKRTFKVPVYQIEPRYQLFKLFPVVLIRFGHTHLVWLTTTDYSLYSLSYNLHFVYTLWVIWYESYDMSPNLDFKIGDSIEINDRTLLSLIQNDDFIIQRGYFRILLLNLEFPNYTISKILKWFHYVLSNITEKNKLWFEQKWFEITTKLNHVVGEMVRNRDKSELSFQTPVRPVKHCFRNMYLITVDM